VRWALRIAGALVAVIVLGLAGFAAWLFLNAAKPSNPVGFQEVTIRDPLDKPLDAGIWYPTNSPSHRTLLGLSAQWLATNGAVAGHGLPLIVISHGNGGLFTSHSDTALALASAGFVVAAVTHTGDNANDMSYVGKPRWLIDRPRHIHLLVDYMLHEWRAHTSLDASRVGMFGFSAGGTTALVTIGGVPDFGRLSAQCRAHPEFACQLWPSLPAAVSAHAWVHDSRITAAVIAAPGFGFAFEPDGLTNVRARVQLWNGTADRNVPYDTNEAVIRKLLPSAPEYHAVKGGGHYAFLPPCPSWLIPMICRDPEGFDRGAFHRAFNPAVVTFFRSALDAAATKNRR